MAQQSRIVIKKRVSLAFLGDEYEKAELVFRSIPISDYDKLMEELPESTPEFAELVQKIDQDAATDEEKKRFIQLKKEKKIDNSSSIKLIREYLAKYFISGKFPGEDGELFDLVVGDLEGLDQDASVHCFGVLTGQNNTLKAPSTTQSSTEPSPPQNS